MFDRRYDTRVRQAAFEWLQSVVAIHGDVLPRAVLAGGFRFEGRREYVTALTRRRLHQQAFRERVLAAYLHHRAFDRFFLGIRPDYVIEVRPDILLETDGPTLRHAIQGLHGQRIGVPRREEHRRSALLLAARFERFLEVATAP